VCYAAEGRGTMPESAAARRLVEASAERPPRVIDPRVGSYSAPVTELAGGQPAGSAAAILPPSLRSRLQIGVDPERASMFSPSVGGIRF
jgi:hypothetical protein